MRSSKRNKESKPKTRAVDLWFTRNAFVVALSDGRELSVPLHWSLKLLNATTKERNSWKLIGKGIGIHWRELDEDLSVASLLSVE